jgi:hypothetical protein
MAIYARDEGKVPWGPGRFNKASYSDVDFRNNFPPIRVAGLAESTNLT